jgi:large subunit ribosomal protein L4
MLIDSLYEEKTLACLMRSNEFAAVAAPHIVNAHFEGAMRQNMAKLALDFYKAFGTHITDLAFVEEVKKLALKSAMSSKAAGGEIVVIDSLKMDEIKTKAFKGFLDKIDAQGKALVVTLDVDEAVVKSARNIPGITTTIATILSPYEVLNSRKMIVDKAALAKIEEVYA